MSKKSKGSSNMILLAGLGAGALLLFAGRSNAAPSGGSSELPSENGSDAEIPNAPKILAVNSRNTESPTPTGIVSDEDGMVTTQSSEQEESSYSSNPVINTVATTGIELIKQAQEYNEIPPLVSTKLTPKEKDIIDKGKLTAALAVKRPDLYKAAYIKSYGGKTQASKKSALAKATMAIDAAVNAATAAQNGGLVKAVKYPAKPEFTFVQSAGGMAAQAAMTQMATLQKAGVKVSPAAQKVSAQVKAAKGSKAKRPVKKAVQPAKKKVAARPVARPAVPGKAKRPVAKKRAIKKQR